MTVATEKARRPRNTEAGPLRPDSKYNTLVRRIEWKTDEYGNFLVANIRGVANVPLAKQRLNQYLDRHNLTIEELIQAIYFPTSDGDQITRSQIGRLIERLSVPGVGD